MSSYAEYAMSNWFEQSQAVGTTGYWSAVYVANSWLHKIIADGRWKLCTALQRIDVDDIDDDELLGLFSA